MCGNVEAEFSVWGSAATGSVKVGYEGDNRVDVWGLVLKVVAGTQIEPAVGVGRVFAPCQWLGYVGGKVLIEE